MKTARLKHLVTINREALDERTDPRLILRYIDIGAVGRGVLIDDPEVLSFGDAPSRARRVVRDGDTIISTVRTYLRAVWPVAGPTEDLVVSTGFAVLTPGDDINPKYLGWLLQSDVVVEEVVARSVGVSYPAINPSEIGDIRVPVPEASHQQSIADYLDAETARIDALIDKKRRMVELLAERSACLVANTIRAMVDRWGTTRLKYAVGRIEVGIVITPSAWYAEEGVVALRGLNIEPGRIDATDLVHITEEGHQVHTKSVLHAGDVVVVRTGEAGAAAVVPGNLEGCNCIDLVIVRKAPAVLPKFLEFVLNSDWTQKHIDKHSVGTIQSHFNVGAMKQVPVPLPPVQDQADAVESLMNITGDLEELGARLHAQIGLLWEHRRALITAAVTGQMELPGAAA